MCYDVAAQIRSQIKYARYYGKSEKEIKDLEDQLQKFDFTPQYRVDGFSRDKVKLLVVTNDQPDQFQQFEWRFIPSSTKDLSELKLNTLNAKSETIYTSWSYKHSAISKHCLIFVDGFFEPHGYGMTKKEKRYGKPIENYVKKAYYYIESKADEPLAFAGLWNSWTDKETGEVHDTCTIITVPASPLLTKIHNVMQRMPAIIPKKLHADWLEAVSERPDPVVKGKAMSLLKPYDDDLLKYKTVYNIKKRDSFGNTPQTIEEFDYTGDDEFLPI